jgi:cytochrome b
MVSFFARLLWGFFGNRFARFSSLLIRRGTLAAARREVRELRSPGGGSRRLGHGPLGRLSATAMFAVLCVSLSTGLLRANTDLFFPPFGHWIAAHVARPGVDPSSLDPADKASLDPARQADFRIIGNLAGTFHRVSAWTLLVLCALHVGGVAFKELRQGGGVFSSMIVGRKVFRASERLAEND